MRIGLDADPIGRDGSGNETYLRGIIGGIQRIATPDVSVVLAGREVEALRAVAGSDAAVVRLPVGIRGDLSIGRALQRAHADVAIGHYNVPFGFQGPRATIVHDVSFRHVPETFPRLLRARIEMSVYLAARCSDLLITVSQYSKEALCDAYRFIEPDRVIVTSEAPSDLFRVARSPEQLDAVRRRYDLPETFVLGVGNVQPRKNYARLVRATQKVGVPLVVVGQTMWRHTEVMESAAGLDVRWLGYVPIAELACLYRLCTVFAYPSLYEGFGLPVVEAMASGAAVVTSARSALPEVCGAGALCVDPRSEDEIAEAIRHLITNEKGRLSLSRRGVDRAEAFSWDRSAGVFLDAVSLLYTGAQ